MAAPPMYTATIYWSAASVPNGASGREKQLTAAPYAKSHVIMK